jgi:hypothetical protein
MTNEMDVLNLDERQRLCWLKANRLTLMFVGVVWLGMIAYDLLHGSTPIFLMAAVPAFGLARLLSYKYYAGRS